MDDKNVLITGGAGFIGSNLAKKLYRLGYNVTVIDNLSSGNIENLKIDNFLVCRFFNDDITSEKMYEYLEGINYVFHFAGIAPLPDNQCNPQNAVNINIGGFMNVLESARKQNVKRVIFSSTSAVYENATSYPNNEHDLIYPHLTYSTCKYCAEIFINSYRKCYNMDIVIVRYFNVYGVGQDMLRKSPPFMGYVIRELLQNNIPQLHSNGEQSRDYIHVDDVNECNYLCMIKEDAKNETFNVSNNKAYSVKELYQIIKSNLKCDIEANYNDSKNFWKNYPELYEGSYPFNNDLIEKEVNKYSLGNNQKAKMLLKWEPKISINVGIQQVINYIKDSYKVV